MKIQYVIEALDERDVRSDESPIFAVRAYDERDHVRGFLYVVEDEVWRLDSDCRQDFYAVMADLSWRPDTKYIARVYKSFIAGNLTNTGLGVGLYRAAAEHAKDLGMVLCADRCRQGGSTSGDALRVYESKRLAEHAAIHGLVIAAR